MNVQNEMLKIGLRLAASAAEAQVTLSMVALEDCNKFCKVDTGELRDSSIRASNFLRGRLVWATKYARHAYYLNEPERSKNPLASRLWAHKAAALYKEKWFRTARDRFLGRAVFGYGRVI
ncbi:MAG: minor capsid protein [Oscillospiraceae bacterium]|nr:minor capsid protein [Oscillospiraceae bacterium]